MSAGNSIRRAHNFKDLTGQRFGSLVVTGFGEKRGKVAYWSVLCDCGVTNLVAGNNLTSGGSKRCGFSCPLRIDPRMKDETGNVYGKWTVISRARSKGGAKWNCQCECGTESVLFGRDLRAGVTNSCGCVNTTDEVGSVYGKLTVVELSTVRNWGKLHWVCRCECGKTVVVCGSVLRRGDQVSCGCNRSRSGGAARKGNQTPEYKSWKHMKHRCSNRSYHRYCGRGITFCKRWSSFVSFMADMGPKPFPEATIERINNDGNYSCGNCTECLANGWPANCKWASAMEQGQNTSKTRLLTHDGITCGLREWGRRIGVSHGTIAMRLKQGWTMKQIVEHYSKP